MIQSFKHKGLKTLYETGESRRVIIEHVERLRDILALLDQSTSVKDLSLPGLRLHKLKGKLKNFHAVDVSGNWRVIFRFEDGDVWDVDYLDYH